MSINEREFYVYIYRDPRSMKPFYVGKGKKNRMFHHLNETFENTENKKKWGYIKGLRNKGLEPIVGRYSKNLTEKQAYELEERLIKKWGRKDFEKYGILTNICINNRPPSSKGKRNAHFNKFGSDHPAYGFKHSEKMIEKRTKSYKEKAKKYGYSQGSKNSRYNDHRTYEEIHGKEKSDKLKNDFHNKRKGSGNSNAKKWLFIGPDGTQICCKGNRDQIAQYLGLNKAMIGRVSRGELEKYKGWSCKEIH